MELSMESDFGALAPLAAFVQRLLDLGLDTDGMTKARLKKLQLDMPIELQVRVAEDGSVMLGSGPPTQQIETSFMPVFHQLRVIVTSSDAADW